jgi:integrase
MFLYITGLRIEEARRTTLSEFGIQLFIIGFTQDKTRKKRPFVGITTQFYDLASLHTWTKVTYNRRKLHSLLPDKISCHSFRHSFVSRNGDANNIADISHSIGHSSVGTTQQYYHVDP